MQGSCLTQVLTLSVVVLSQLTQQAPQFGQEAAQYHIQTDQGSNRFFRFQTHTGQYRKEVRHDDGSQEGTYGWVDPTGVLRLFDYIADDLGYRIVQESLYNVGPASPGFSLKTRGGDIELGFEVYPLDGAGVAVGRLGGSSLPTTKLHLADGDFRDTSGYSVNALISSLPHEVHPNPLGKQIGATFFTGKPAPPPAPAVVVGGRDVALPPLEPENDGIVVGHTGREDIGPRAPAARTGIVIGLSHNEPVAQAAPVSRASQPRTVQAPRRNPIVIGSTRRKRSLN